ncbi:MAG: hypothetical protein GX575_18095 [Candidatus Anammoximicrobium sp.]|nr:hypothetical protein [Candidatus Anammoximicrobium sp.]
MDTFSTSDLRRLTTAQQKPCVSIFMPTHAAGRDGQQDTLRLKNLLAQAERGLLDHGLRVSEIKRLLEPVRELSAESGFWEKRSSGLAVFVTEGQWNRFRVPLPLDELVVVNRRFHIKPLLPLIGANDQYFVLALSQNRVRLLVGRPFGMQEVKVEGLPQNLAQFLNYDSGGRPSLAHAAPRSQAGKSSAVVHRLGGEREPVKDELAQYFRAIDAALREPLRDQRAPLILAGVQYLLPIYREISSYACLANEELFGNSDHLSEHELHSRTWPLIKARVADAQQEAAAKYRKLAGTGKTSDDLCRIVPAAHQGRIESLFVDRAAHRWGVFDPATGEVSQHAAAFPRGDDELLDLAAVQTLLHRGAVYAVAAEQIPAPPAVAVFRY